MTSCRVPTKTVHWIVRRNAEGQRIPVRGPFSTMDDLRWGQANCRPGTEVQTFVYDQFGAVITD